MTKAFSYDEFTTRNISFVTKEQQTTLRNLAVFICGTGGMGGACIFSLARAGVGNLIIADIDEFKISNLNRQAFAFLHTVDKHKAETTRDICLTINPGANCRGWFFNPYVGRVEHPKNALFALILKPIARRFLRKMMVG